jgi:REP element-mobilizing transposase RayT
MAFSSELPELCRQCGKSTASSIHKNCKFCRDLGIQEEVLCYLNRTVQNPAKFKCHAFQPLLRRVDSSGTRATTADVRPKEHLKKEVITRLLQSDKIKYNRALALQRLTSDPEGVFVDIKYHFAWNVKHRQPIFNLDADVLDFAHEVFLGSSQLVGGFLTLLWMAPDHVHVYVDSDGEHSVETMVQDIKGFSESAMLARFVEMKERLDGKLRLWDAAYYSETIG